MLVCPYAQTCQSLQCSYTQSFLGVDKDTDQHVDIKPCLIPQNGRLNDVYVHLCNKYKHFVWPISFFYKRLYASTKIKKITFKVFTLKFEIARLLESHEGCL